MKTNKTKQNTFSLLKECIGSPAKETRPHMKYAMKEELVLTTSDGMLVWGDIAFTYWQPKILDSIL
jgi:hypothetical protein